MLSMRGYKLYSKHILGVFFQTLVQQIWYIKKTNKKPLNITSRKDFEASAATVVASC